MYCDLFLLFCISRLKCCSPPFCDTFILLLIMYEALHIMDIKNALIYNTICFWFSYLLLKMCALFMQGWVCAHFLIGTGNRTFWFLTILLLTCIAVEISWNKYVGRQHLLIACQLLC